MREKFDCMMERARCSRMLWFAFIFSVEYFMSLIEALFSRLLPLSCVFVWLKPSSRELINKVLLLATEPCCLKMFTVLSRALVSTISSGKRLFFGDSCPGESELIRFVIIWLGLRISRPLINDPETFELMRYIRFSIFLIPAGLFFLRLAAASSDIYYINSFSSASNFWRTYDKSCSTLCWFFWITLIVFASFVRLEGATK